ncbi:MAG: hypothetical protein ACRC5M_03105, partial [Anaeroplasmataceae bacterium]
MARSVKKVRTPKTKKFWIILSSSITAVLLTTLIIVLCVVFIKGDEKYYKFKNREGLKIEDRYISYSEFDKLRKSSSVDNLFLFIYDNNFVPSDNAEHLAMEENIYKLYKSIIENTTLNEEKGNPIDFEFFVIDVYTSKNKLLLSNPEYGAQNVSNDDGTETLTPIVAQNLLYFHEGVSQSYGFGTPGSDSDIIAGNSSRII